MGTISVEGTSGTDVGIAAVDLFGNAFAVGAHAAERSTSARSAAAMTRRSTAERGASSEAPAVAPGSDDNTAIVVGNATSTFSASADALGGASALAGGLNGDSITVNGVSDLVGVNAHAFSVGGNATVLLGNQTTGAGVIVNGNATTGFSNFGVRAWSDAGGLGNATVQIGSTPITITGGTGIDALGGASVKITTAGDVTSLTGTAIFSRCPRRQRHRMHRQWR